MFFLGCLVGLLIAYLIGMAFTIILGWAVLTFRAMRSPTDIPPKSLWEVLCVGLLWPYYMLRKRGKDDAFLD